MNHLNTLPRIAYRFCYGLGLAFVVGVITLLVLFWVTRAALRPPHGAWATRVFVDPVALEMGVPSLIWLGTTPGWRSSSTATPCPPASARCRWRGMQPATPCA